MTPAKPDVFQPEVPPPGFEVKLVSFWQRRPIIVPTSQYIVTFVDASADLLLQ